MIDRNKKRVSDIISTSDIESWTTKNLIIISAGTGAGKSYFVKNQLYEYAKSEGKKILFLIHRTNCVNQFRYEIERDHKTDTIDIMTYQKMEYDILNYDRHINFPKYKYIVYDEFHYFVSDTNFNKSTDISFTEIMRQRQCIKLFMSATGEKVEYYLSRRNRKNICKYSLSSNYSYVQQLTFFLQDEDVNYIADMCIKHDTKAIFFIQSATKAYKFYKQYADYSIFNCGKSDAHYKYVDEEQISAMLKNEQFDKQFLITTSCFDAGANIIDRDVKIIVADIKDISSLIQCLGRKRSIDGGDKVSFFIKTINNQQLSGLERSTSKQVEMADYLSSHDTQALIVKYPRQVDYNVIIYDDVRVNKQKNNMATKRINQLMYYKKKSDITFYKQKKTTFFVWLDNNYYEVEGEKQMDINKDILQYGNKQYHPELCLIVPHSINAFYESIKLGKTNITYNSRNGKYTVRICDNNEKTVASNIDTINQALDEYCDIKQGILYRKAKALKDKMPEKVYNALMKTDIKAINQKYLYILRR